MKYLHLFANYFTFENVEPISHILWILKFKS